VGCGPRSSALVGGFTAHHRALERELASLKGTKDALLFPTGYAANTAVVAVLAAAGAASAAKQHSPGSGSSSSSSSSSSSGSRQRPHQPTSQQQQPQQPSQPAQVVIFSDELNHASLIDGARLATRGPAGAVALRVYRHNDLAHLESLLAASPPGARRLVLTDALFSMDGDWADLRVRVCGRVLWCQRGGPGMRT
jgi:8-amino-7-oxononanoate synthase